MTALTAEELMAWVEKTTDGWRRLIASHPEVWAMPCDMLATGTVAGLLQHICAVELRYAQRIKGVAESSYSEILMDSPETLFGFHEQAMTMLRELVADERTRWDEEIGFETRSAGTLRATKRTILVHALMHSVRHYAQLASLVRQHGVKPDWAMDYLFMTAK